MSVKRQRNGLGRGLDALLPKTDKGLEQVNLNDLKVSEYQPRKYIDPEAIAELAASIAEKGVLQPLLVRKVATGYEIVAGERRFRAAKKAGLSSVPVVIKELNDQETLEIAIIENLQREDLNPIEEALAYEKLKEFGLNQEAIAKAVGKSRSAIANTVRLLKLPPNALEALRTNTLTAGHARAILAQPDEDKDWAFTEIIKNELTVRQAEALSRKTVTKARGKSASDGRYAELETDLERHVGTKVKIKGGSKGRLELHYHSADELERLLELLGYQA